MKNRYDLITEAELNELSGFITDTLGEVFEGRGLVFDEPIMKILIDEHDEERLHIVIVFEGDESNYDTNGALKVRRRVKDKLYDMGFEGMPSLTIVPRLLEDRFMRRG